MLQSSRSSVRFDLPPQKSNRSRPLRQAMIASGLAMGFVTTPMVFAADQPKSQIPQSGVYDPRQP